MNSTIVGIDLGFRNTGLVHAAPTHTPIGYRILGHACVSTEKEAGKKGLFVAVDDVQQCQRLFAGVMDFITASDPGALVIELPTAGAKGARANRAMGIVTGMIGAISAATGLPSVWISPTDGKVAMCRKKTASKDEMMDAARALWPDAGWPATKGKFEHIADAAAALLAAKESDVYKLLRGRVE